MAGGRGAVADPQRGSPLGRRIQNRHRRLRQQPGQAGPERHAARIEARRAGVVTFAKAAQRKRKGRRERRVVARGNGRFRTDGRYGSATVRGTEWQTVDTCKATSVRVFSGVVSVFDRVRGKRRDVRAGQRVVIRARRR